MTKKNLSDCPVCSHELTITSYECKKCKTKIEGEFKVDKFSTLSDKQKDFVELFVMKRGSIKEIEKALGISYPTVRNMLDDAIASLGHEVDRYDSRMEILTRLDKGELTSEEATKLLDDLNYKEV